MKNKKSFANLGVFREVVTPTTEIQKSEQDIALEFITNGGDIEKARQGLVKKVITNSKGHKQTVWVKAGEEQKQGGKTTENVDGEPKKKDKVLMAREIMEGLKFLGINTEKFAELKEKHGGMEGLHEYVAKQLSGESDSEPKEKLFEEMTAEEHYEKSKDLLKQASQANREKKHLTANSMRKQSQKHFDEATRLEQKVESPKKEGSMKDMNDLDEKYHEISRTLNTVNTANSVEDVDSIKKNADGGYDLMNKKGDKILSVSATNEITDSVKSLKRDLEQGNVKKKAEYSGKDLNGLLSSKNGKKISSSEHSNFLSKLSGADKENADSAIRIHNKEVNLVNSLKHEKHSGSNDEKAIKEVHDTTWVGKKQIFDTAKKHGLNLEVSDKFKKTMK